MNNVTEVFGLGMILGAVIASASWLFHTWLDGRRRK